jgi:hypothetical protein
MKDKAPAANHSAKELFQPDIIAMCWACISGDICMWPAGMPAISGLTG